jgi:CRISPR/Cas system-associated protein Cas10 (large subunit of type III CRISPR-Cas system)
MDDLTEEEKNFLNERIDRLISYVVHLRGSFDLTSRERGLRRIVKATSVYLSSQVEEVISDKLKGYGETTLEVKETLEPILNEMISILRQMESIV